MPEKVTQWGFSKDQFAVVARWMARAEAAEAEVARLRAERDAFEILATGNEGTMIQWEGEAKRQRNRAEAAEARFTELEAELTRTRDHFEAEQGMSTRLRVRAEAAEASAGVPQGDYDEAVAHVAELETELELYRKAAKRERAADRASDVY